MRRSLYRIWTLCLPKHQIGSALLLKVMSSAKLLSCNCSIDAQPAFWSGCIRDGHAYGRGTLDVKYTVAAMMEAASFMKRRNLRPRRTVLFAFGHDEEVGGSPSLSVSLLSLFNAADFYLRLQVTTELLILLRCCRQEAYGHG